MERKMKIKNESIINIHTNVDELTKEELYFEANKSKKKARVRLLNTIHATSINQDLMETAYAYDPVNDMSFTGEFEAITV